MTEPVRPTAGVTRRPATDEEARAMASAIRLRILRLCLDDALTNKEIAERLGKDPASVLYHVRRLVRTGFLVPEPERRGQRGAREVPYRATGKSWRLEVVDNKARNAGTAAMIEAFVADVEDVGVENMYGIARLGLRLTEANRQELADRLQALFDEYAARPPDAGGDPVGLFFAALPDTRPPHRNSDADPAPP